MELQNYKINELIQKGNRYNIYSAIRTKDDLKVIIKEPLNHYDNFLSKTQISNEFIIGRIFNHKNIIGYIDLIETKTNYFLIKEYFKSEKLHDYINEKAFGLESKKSKNISRT